VNIQKNLPLYVLGVGLVLLTSGCGKKKEVVATSNKTLAQSHIPVLQEEVESFFVNDDSNISEFAFVDEASDGKEDLKDLYAFGDEKDSGTLVAANEDDKDESFVSWQDYDNDAQDVQFKTVLFDLNKNEVRADQKEALKEDIALAKDAVKEGKSIAVHGHTCELGAPSFNLPLSERRAQVIKKEMVKSGIPEDKIKTVGCGKEIPASFVDKEGKTKDQYVAELSVNRRSEISIAA